MELLPSEVIIVDHTKIHELDRMMKSIYRLIIYSRHHSDDDILNSYMKGAHNLRELLSIKNAQMEAQDEFEAEEYLMNFRAGLGFAIDQIIEQTNFGTELQLFHLLRLASPEANAMHPNHYRQTLVQIGSHVCPEPYLVPMLVNDLFHRMGTLTDPVVKAIYFHHEMIRIHPFADGNGRVTRLAKNWMYMFDLYPPTFITDAAGKTQYINALGNSFRALYSAPRSWNEHTAYFFDLELDRLLTNATLLYETIDRKGTIRERQHGHPLA